MVSSTLTFFYYAAELFKLPQQAEKNPAQHLLTLVYRFVQQGRTYGFLFFFIFFYSRIPLCWKQFTFVGEKKPSKNAAIFCSLTGEKNHNGKFSLFCNTKSWEHIVCRLLFYTVLITFGHVARHFPGWFSFNIRWHIINILS